jgi:hypothetical protein
VFAASSLVSILFEYMAHSESSLASGRKHLINSF